MTKPDTVFIMPGNAAFGGLPYVTQPESIDLWPSASATKEAVGALVEMVKRGYGGVKIETCSLADGRMAFNYYTDDTTPEGRLAKGLMALASVGKSQPVADSMAILERVYREQNLTLPKKQSPVR